MTAEKAYGYFYGIHLHFTTENYNVLKYGPNTQQARSRYDILTRDQKYRFDWLANRFTQTQDLVYACIGSEFSGLNIRYADKTDIIDAYFKFKSRRESITHNLVSEYSKYKLDGSPQPSKIIFQYLAGKYSPEFILLLDSDTEFLTQLWSSNTLSFAKPQILCLLKYKHFFSAEKYLDTIINKNEDTISA